MLYCSPILVSVKLYVHYVLVPLRANGVLQLTCAVSEGGVGASITVNCANT